MTATLAFAAEASDFEEGLEAIQRDDYPAAALWFRMAAEQGDAPAQFNLGVMHENGRGVPKNDAEAVAWFRRAAEQGYAPTQFNLGVMHANGRGVPQDFVQGYAWVNLAVAQGHPGGREARDLLREQMTRDQVAEAQRLSRDLHARITARP